MLNNIKATLTEMLGSFDIMNEDEVWSKISLYKNWQMSKPSSFIIQGRTIAGVDKYIVEILSINIPRFDTLSFSFEKRFDITNPREINESYAFYLKYPEKLLIIVASTFAPLAKVINLVDGSVTMSMV